MKDCSNQAVFSVLGYDLENENKHRLIGRVAFHVHKLVKVGLNVRIYFLPAVKCFSQKMLVCCS